MGEFDGCDFVLNNRYVNCALRTKRTKNRIEACRYRCIYSRTFCLLTLHFFRYIFRIFIHSNPSNMSSVNVCSASSSTASANVHSAQADNVNVKSVVQTETQSKVSQENTKKINDLMARLSKSPI